MLERKATDFNWWCVKMEREKCAEKEEKEKLDNRLPRQCPLDLFEFHFVPNWRPDKVLIDINFSP